MIHVIIPNNNVKERKYVVGIIFKEFLGVEYQISIDEKKHDYYIYLDNTSQIIVKDGFFSCFEDNLSYLDEENIPISLKYLRGEFIEEDLPVLYGTPEIEVQNDKIVCGVDIFASSFFMLTRWEEYVIKRKDKHNRFSAFESLACKHNFLHRPLVNEYVELLWKLLISLNFKDRRKERIEGVYLTHDVDDIKYWQSFKQFVNVIGGDFIKRKSLGKAATNIYSYLTLLMKIRKDPYDTFDWLMAKSESVNERSRFYFMSGGTSHIYDNRYKLDDARSIIEIIKKRNHIIGLHPSYNTYTDLEQFIKEKRALEQVIGEEVLEGRQHYLRFEVPTTWQVWEDAGMEIDSTCGYADKEGFRCGTENMFSVFNIITRKQLKLKERPLIFMDVNHIYSEVTTLQSIDIINEIFGSKLTSRNTLLFHNSNFVKRDVIDFKLVYDFFLRTFKENS